MKGNQKELYEDIQDSFRILPIIDSYEDIDYGHGRIETRKCSILTNLDLVENSKKWIGLVSIVMVERERFFKATGKKENEKNFYISTLGNAK